MSGRMVQIFNVCTVRELDRPGISYKTVLLTIISVRGHRWNHVLVISRTKNPFGPLIKIILMGVLFSGPASSRGTERQPTRCLAVTL